MDAQIPYVKWHRTMHRVSLPHLWTPNRRWKILVVESADANAGIQMADCIFIEKHPCISGPTQVKPLLVKGQPCLEL